MVPPKPTKTPWLVIDRIPTVSNKSLSTNSCGKSNENKDANDNTRKAKPTKTIKTSLKYPQYIQTNNSSTPQIKTETQVSTKVQFSSNIQSQSAKQFKCGII
jgi:hypothetical protein